MTLGKKENRLAITVDLGIADLMLLPLEALVGIKNGVT